MVVRIKCLQRTKYSIRRFLWRKPLFSLLLIACLSSATFFTAYKLVFEWHLNTPNSITQVSREASTISKLIHELGENLHGAKDENIRDEEIENEFKKQWFRVQKQRVDWKQILAPCADNTIVGQTPPGWGKENATSLKNSYVEFMDIRPAGQFSRFIIRTKTDDGRHKVIGGDFWKV
jgi:hypothetical protein